ncbi:MAG: tRNA (guanosine(46)-N7)-methyltransferase TrmB [Clostridia bacterium]|nr:tRNA (guanosine(46)-N7)-methyltransferase TrmB [Clostridia bacterium]
MRQRKVKNLEEKLAELSAFKVEEPALHRGKWAQLFSVRTVAFDDGEKRVTTAVPGSDEKKDINAKPKVFLEIGCGKGRFLNAHAAGNHSALYIGIEGQETVILRALEKAEELKSSNIVFIGSFVRDLSEIFADGELDGIYLNFSDPWPKARHAKRRLTYRDYLKQYKRIIAAGGFLEFKTDNDALFDFTLEEIEECGFRPDMSSRDLHAEGAESETFREELKARNSFADAITTEYEEKFMAAGKNINFVRLQF